MNFLICYITVAGGEQTENYAMRFTSTFRNFGPGASNWTMVAVSNGGPMDCAVQRHFKGLSNCLPERDNSGHDIGAYIEVSNRMSYYDALLCCGQSVYFHRPGWLKRLAQVWEQHGPGLYGFYASNNVRPHLNTTCFAVAPELLRGWNQKVETMQQRYDFEHGQYSFMRQVVALRKPVRLVMWDYDLAPTQWRTTPNEFWRGDQSQCLMWCGHTDRWAKAEAAIKTRWTNNADRGLQVAR